MANNDNLVVSPQATTITTTTRPWRPPPPLVSYPHPCKHHGGVSIAYCMVINTAGPSSPAETPTQSVPPHGSLLHLRSNGDAGRVVNQGSALWDFSKCAANAHSQVEGLAQEVSMLTGSLTSIEKTLMRFQSQSPSRALADQDVHHQCRLALRNCELTLDELKELVDAIKKTAASNRLWRFKTAIDLSTHSGKLDEFRAKMNRSNAALQTMLHTLIVFACPPSFSLSLQSNLSQNRIVADLRRLNTSIEKVRKLSMQRERHDDADDRARQNLRHLAQAARNFHSVASVQGGEGSSVTASSWRRDAVMTTSSVVVGDDMSSLRRMRLHDYVYSNVTEVEDDDDGLLSQMPLVQVLEDFALAHMKRRRFHQAADFLQQAILQQKKKAVDDDDDDMLIRLQTRLALCHLFQGDRDNVVATVTKLATAAAAADENDDQSSFGLDVYNLMHALALTYLAEYDFDGAEKWCRRALRAKEKLLGMSHAETLETLGLLAWIYKMSDNLVMKEVIRRIMPIGFRYSHPPDELAFIARHTRLLPIELASWNSFIIPDVVVELDGQEAIHHTTTTTTTTTTTMACVETQVKTAVSRSEKLLVDTSKEVVIRPEITVDDDECAAKPQGSDIKRRLAQMLRTASIRRAVSDPPPMMAEAGKASVSGEMMKGWLRSRRESVLRKSKSLSRHARLSGSVVERPVVASVEADLETLDAWLAKTCRRRLSVDTDYQLEHVLDNNNNNNNKQPSQLMSFPVFELEGIHRPEPEEEEEEEEDTETVTIIGTHNRRHQGTSSDSSSSSTTTDADRSLHSRVSQPVPRDTLVNNKTEPVREQTQCPAAEEEEEDDDDEEEEEEEDVEQARRAAVALACVLVMMMCCSGASYERMEPQFIINQQHKEADEDRHQLQRHPEGDDASGAELHDAIITIHDDTNQTEHTNHHSGGVVMTCTKHPEQTPPDDDNESSESNNHHQLSNAAKCLETTSGVKRAFSWLKHDDVEYMSRVCCAP
ncbi:hypothetical protein XA68_14090 [Ophiocordyceps unilateralis]|uniref:Fungal N-terminal domain-containing protein n=1 Tax=Ophiocordyceps unilateralis TaxID=268505 RepID=A0A2A9PB68_OPHUN|nr:hypothetical protein XA68_14090 [Ophiocordyceps unilateralis]